MEIIVRNIPLGITEAELRALLVPGVTVGDIYRVETGWRGMLYDLRSAYMKLYGEDAVNEDIIDRACIFRGRCRKCTWRMTLNDDFAECSLVVLGLDVDCDRFSVKRDFQRFCPNEVSLFQSHDCSKLCAVVTFSGARERDRALLMVNSDKTKKIMVYPRRETHILHKRMQRKSTNSDGSKKMVEFVRGDEKFECFEKDVISICATVKHKFSVDDGVGDFMDLKDYIDGKTIYVDETNVLFLRRVGVTLGISELAELTPTDYSSDDNVVYMANIVDSNELDMMVPRVLDALSVLMAQRRLSLLPIPLILMIREHVSLREVLLQMCDMKQDKTALVEALGCSGLDSVAVQILLHDEGVDLNVMSDRLQSRIHERKGMIAIAMEPSRPFDGLFRFLWKQENANPCDTGIIKLVSSGGVGRLSCILDADRETVYATDNCPGGCITFDLGNYTLSMNGYSFGSHSIRENGHTTSWAMRGSHDGNEWLDLDCADDNMSLVEEGVYVTTFPPSPRFRYFCIEQTAPASMGFDTFRIACIEFFGAVHLVE